MKSILREFVYFNYCLGRWLTSKEQAVLKVTFIFLAFEIAWFYLSLNIIFNKIENVLLSTIFTVGTYALFMFLFDKSIVRYIHKQKFNLDFQKMSSRKFVIYRLIGLFIIVFSLIQIFIIATIFPRH
jgi:hypothetical protein